MIRRLFETRPARRTEVMLRVAFVSVLVLVACGHYLGFLNRMEMWLESHIPTGVIIACGIIVSIGSVAIVQIPPGSIAIYLCLIFFLPFGLILGACWEKVPNSLFILLLITTFYFFIRRSIFWESLPKLKPRSKLFDK